MLHLASFIWTILKILVYGWIVALYQICRKLREIFIRWHMRRKVPGRARRASEAPCSPINEKSFTHPDPLIYSQYDLIARGYAVTWDNPDIELRKGGIAIPSSKIDPNTDYEIVARVWNNSIDAVVVGLPVVFSYLSFGVGVKVNPIGVTSVLRLGVKGGPDHPAFASINWRTPATPGHYCLQVFLAPADDTNFNNNLGQENVNVGKVSSPASFTFQLANQGQEEQRFRFEVDAYAIPDLPPCGQRERMNPAIKVLPQTVGATPAVPAAHNRADYPVPTGWQVIINPAEPQLHPGEEVTVDVLITPPAGFAGRQPFNINAFNGQAFAGGVTLYVEAP